MKLYGVIARRLLVNYRLDPTVAESLLPEGLHVQQHRGYAVAGICIIQLEKMRPLWVPEALGTSSFNAAHRIAVVLPNGEPGVYVPRRETNSTLARHFGSRFVGGDYGRAQFQSRTGVGTWSIEIDGGDLHVNVVGAESPVLSPGSIFKTVDEASSFFQRGGRGFSPDASGALREVELAVDDWHVDPFEARVHASSFFDSLPKGTVEYDHALLMRGARHSWNTGRDCASARASLH